MESLIYFILTVCWLAGIALAQGWYIILAILVPFYAWYLVIERVLQLLGVLR